MRRFAFLVSLRAHAMRMQLRVVQMVHSSIRAMPCLRSLTTVAMRGEHVNKVDASELRMMDAIIGGRCKELRPKNHGVLKIVSWPELWRALQSTRKVDVLFLQHQVDFDDAATAGLVETLQRSPNINGVNLGELRKVTPAGWIMLASAIANTSLTTIYVSPWVGHGGPDAFTLIEIKIAILGNRRRYRGVIKKHPSMWRPAEYQGAMATVARRERLEANRKNRCTH
jgi:hypothetical protein